MQGITCKVCDFRNEERDMNHSYRVSGNELYKQGRCVACDEELTEWILVPEVDRLKRENEQLKKLNEFMRGYIVYFAENNWYGDEADRQHQDALRGLVELEEEIRKSSK